MNVFASITRIRPIYAWIAAAVAVVLVAGLITFVNMRKTINLSVDGEQREVVTFATSVADVLEDEGIELAEHDVVAPDPGADLRSGLEIVVRYAHQLSIEIDGEERDVWTTAASAEEALADMARRGSQTAILASRSTTHGRLALDLPLSAGSELLIDDAGEENSISISQDKTLGDVFADQDIEIFLRDEVAITGDNADSNADVIVEITRISEETRTSTKKIKFESKTQNDSSIYKGESKLVTKGKNGEKELRHRVVLVNGEVTDKELLGQKVLTDPVHEVTAVGTKERPAPKPKPTASSGGSTKGAAKGSATKKASGSTDSLNWGALAQCESGGSATIVSANGLYHGMYQFSVPTWKSVGGAGLPSQAPVAEQTARAKALYERSGAGQWPVCGKNLFR